MDEVAFLFNSNYRRSSFDVIFACVWKIVYYSEEFVLLDFTIWEDSI